MNKFIAVLFFLVTCQHSFSQISDRVAFKWKKPGPFCGIPDEFKNEDAVAIYNETGTVNYFDVTHRINFTTANFLKRRLRILTANGLKEYSNIVIRKRASVKISSLDARTIKKNGEVIPINPGDIKVLKNYDEDLDIYYDEYRIAIPGVEIGDEVEYIYAYTRTGLTLANDVYLHTDIPCIRSSFELTLNRGLVTDIFSINNMGTPQSTEDETTQKLRWTMTNVPSVKNQNYAIVEKELPYVHFKLNKVVMSQYKIDEPVSMSSWSGLYKELARDDYDHNSKTKGLESYFVQFKISTDTMNNFNKVKFFVDKINTDFKLLKYANDGSMLKPITYFLDKKEIDENNLRLFYKYLFYYLKIPYETCFGRSRYSGDLNTSIVSDYQITHVFYSFKDEQNQRHFLFPSSGYQVYNVDERPYSLEETLVIFLNKQNPFNNDPPAEQINKMGRLPADLNSRTITCSYSVNVDSNYTGCDVKLLYSGMPSMRYRSNWLQQMEEYKKDGLIEWLDEKENKNFSLDTVFIERKETILPYKFMVRIKSKENDVISTSGENISSLKIHIPLQHSKLRSYAYKRITDLYTPYLYNDEINLFIQFPFSVDIINTSGLTKSLSNDAGSFTMSIHKVSDTVYKITSAYKIKTGKLSKDKYQLLVDLNDLVDQLKELDVIYKKL